MLSNNNQSLNKVEKMVLTICLIFAVFITAAFSKADKDHTVKKSTSIKNVSLTTAVKTDSLTKTNAAKSDTGTMGSGTLKVYKPEDLAEGSMLRFTKKIKNQLYLTYLFKQDGILYQYTAHDDGSNATYYVNGNVLSKDQETTYQPKFDRLMSELDRVQSPKSPVEPGQLQHNGGIGEIVDEADMKTKANADSINSNPQDVALIKAKLVKLTTKQALDSMKLKALIDSKGSHYVQLAKLKGSLAAIDTQRAIAAYKLRIDSSGNAWVKKPIDAKKPYGSSYDKKYKGDYDAKYKGSYPNEPQEPKGPIVSQVALPAKPAPAASSAVSPSPLPTVGDQITKQLIDEHLIKDRNNYTFKITNDALYIDGVKQPDAVHQQIIKQCLKPGDKINLTRTNTTTN